MHLPLQSKWLYVGTERGNVHVVQIENFNLSGYIINWNKAIELYVKALHCFFLYSEDSGSIIKQKYYISFKRLVA